MSAFQFDGPSAWSTDVVPSGSSWTTPYTAAAAKVLPHFSADELRRCSRRRVESLSECVNLSPAATGSTSVAHGMARSPLFEKYGNGTHVILRNETGFPLQAHGFTAKAYQQHAHQYGLPVPRCFIMAVRDPVSRLTSSFVDDIRVSKRLYGASGPLKQEYRNLSAYVSDTTTWEEVYPDFPELAAKRSPKWNLRFLYSTVPNADGFIRNVREGPSAASGTWRYSVATPSYPNPLRSFPGPTNGSFYLISQAYYLKGIDCATSEIHLLCTERLSTMWQDLLRSFGVGDPPPLPHARSSSNARGYKRSVINDPANALFLRQHMYPWDAELHRLVCAGPHPAAPSTPPPIAPPAARRGHGPDHGMGNL